MDEENIQVRNPIKEKSSYDLFYRRLRKNIRDWGEKKIGSGEKAFEIILLAPDLFHLLVCLIFDDEIATEEKVSLIGTAAYFISPVDIIPEAIVGPLGYIDDIALVAVVLSRFLNTASEDKLRKYWAGDKDILSTLNEILKISDEMIGQGLWKKIKEMFGK